MTDASAPYAVEGGRQLGQVRRRWDLWVFAALVAAPWLLAIGVIAARQGSSQQVERLTRDA